jgi:hypothetical protein
LGDEAFALLSQEWFRTGWDALYRACPWATVFQSREFVTTWYRIFQQQYLPVLLWAGPPHHPTGLLTLALPISPAGTPTKGPLVGAGQYEAEYQTWLAEPAHGESFIQAALEQVQRRFPQHPIQFRFLPRGTPLGWLRRNPVWRKRGVLQPYNRPLMEMSHPDFPKLFRKTEFRNKLNRLKRLGELRFEHVTDLERFAGVLQGLTIQYDFRQGALFNKNQFRDNPEKAELLLALFDQNLLHVTLLLVNDEVIASIVAVNGQDWVHLGGINIHTPFFSNFSPGFVHFLLLGQQLAQEGVAVFDLTPGEDAYKKRYATSHDQVHELFIAGSLPYRLKKRLRKQVHSRLVKAGIRPMTVELALKKKIYLFKMSMQRIRQQGLLRPLLNRAKRLWAPPEQQIYVWQADSLPLPASNLLQQNNLADLLNFDAQGASLSRWEFLEDALRRFEQGERSYTWSENGLLLGCAWLGVPGQSRRNSLPRLQLPEGAVLLQGLYCHPAAKNRWQAFLAAVAGEAGQDKEPVGVYALAADKDPVLNQALVAAGFRAAAQPGK